MPSYERRYLVTQQIPLIGAIDRSFHVDLKLPNVVKNASRWLCHPQDSNTSHDGVLHSPLDYPPIKRAMSSTYARLFQYMLYATSITRLMFDLGQPLQTVWTVLLKDMGSICGHFLLRDIELRMQPRQLRRARKEQFQAYFLLLVGTILSVSSVPREWDAPIFPCDSTIDTAETSDYTLWDARKDHICRILGHYLILVGRRLNLDIDVEAEQAILGSGHQWWLSEGARLWTKQPPPNKNS
jgi:hypothetical protein